MNKTFSAMWSDKLDKAIEKLQPSKYPIECHFGSTEFNSIQAAVDQGIDSRLEAIFFEQGSGDHNKIRFVFDPKSLRVLIRRLLESDDDESMSLASGICSTLDIELV